MVSPKKLPIEAMNAPHSDGGGAVRGLLEALVCKPSVTPDDQGCQTLLAGILSKLGFVCETIALEGVTNLWAIHSGGVANLKGETSAPLLVFAGHTDVVPPGPLSAWESDPFVLSEREGKLYGRGVADMKGAIAAYVVAVQEFLAEHKMYPGRLGFLITSDEEGPGTYGTVQVVSQLVARGESIDYCIIGEPTCEEVVGDTIKTGRRGSLSGKLTLQGKQGHIAYPHLARNAIHAAFPILTKLVETKWDSGDQYFSPTSFQISNIAAGVGVNNVIPGVLTADFNFRFSPASTVQSLKERVASTVEAFKLPYHLEWHLSGEPFWTVPGALVSALSDAISEELGIQSKLSTTGGTSDGRFLIRLCREMVEFGVRNATIHQANESILDPDLEKLKTVYKRTIEKLFLT